MRGSHRRRRSESNRGIGVLQTPALPLGYVAERTSDIDLPERPLARIPDICVETTAEQHGYVESKIVQSRTNQLPDSSLPNR